MVDQELPKAPAVYLVHFDAPISHASHYLGATRNLNSRIKKHRANHGASLLAEANKRGITWIVIRYWLCDTAQDAYQLEKIIKRQKNSKPFCPICGHERNMKCLQHMVTVPGDKSII